MPEVAHDPTEERSARPGPRPGTSRAAVLHAARSAVLAGRPIELGPLAKELGVGRSTVYRWFGDREGLLGEVLAGLVRQAAAIVRHDIDGAGRDRLWRSVAGFVDITLGLEPFGALVVREPLVVVRVIMDPRGHVQPALTEVLLEQIALDRPAGDLPPIDDQVLAAVVVQSTMVALYARTVLGEEPNAEQALGVARAVIYSGEGGAGTDVTEALVKQHPA